MYDLDRYEWGDSLLTPPPEVEDTWPHPRHTQEPFDHEVIVERHRLGVDARCLTSNCDYHEFGLDFGAVNRHAEDHGTVTVVDIGCAGCDSWGFIDDLDCTHSGFDLWKCSKPCPVCRPDRPYQGCRHRGAA